MVAPEYDDGILAVRTFLKGIEEPTHIHVGVGTGGEVRLNRGFPAPAFQKLGMIALRPCHFNSRRGYVIEIIFNVRRELNFIEREVFIIFAWGHKGQMRFIESTGDEIGFLTLFRKSFHAVIDAMPVDNVLVFEIGVLFIDMVPVVLVDSRTVTG